VVRNRVVLSGRISEKEALRYTPAGVPALNFTISHASEQVEAGNRREVQCEVASLALDQAALLASRLNVGDDVLVEGFLARRSRNSTQLVLHVNKVEFAAGAGLKPAAINQT